MKIRDLKAEIRKIKWKGNSPVCQGVFYPGKIKFKMVCFGGWKDRAKKSDVYFSRTLERKTTISKEDVNAYLSWLLKESIWKKSFLSKDVVFARKHGVLVKIGGNCFEVYGALIAHRQLFESAHTDFTYLVPCWNIMVKRGVDKTIAFWLLEAFSIKAPFYKTSEAMYLEEGPLHRMVDTATTVDAILAVAKGKAPVCGYKAHFSSVYISPYLRSRGVKLSDYVNNFSKKIEYKKLNGKTIKRSEVNFSSLIEAGLALTDKIKGGE